MKESQEFGFCQKNEFLLLVKILRFIIMSRLLIFIFLLLFFTNCKKDHSTIDSSFQKTLNLVGRNFDSNYGKPLIILKISNPWAMVIGADVPQFALYEKGQVIYKFIQNREVQFFEITLTKDEINQLIHSFGITDEFFMLETSIESSESTDQPTNIITLDLDKSKTISVYGNLNSIDVRMKTPLPFKAVYDRIMSYKNDSAKVWIPQKIEVMFWDYNYAPNKRPWIKGFPDLKSSSTIKFNEDSYSVFLDKSNYEEFIRFYKAEGEKEAVEINGRKMAISYRLPFPNIR